MKGLSAFSLKMIAVATMLVDHIAVAVLSRMLFARGVTEDMMAQPPGAWSVMSPVLGEKYRLYMTYMIMREIGRIAFPIFAFMLVEGMTRTRSLKKYALRLGIFALISEIPYDLAFNSAVLELQSQNIFFTLLIALVAMIALERIESGAGISGVSGGSEVPEVPKVTEAKKSILTAATVAAALVLAMVLRTDYGAAGIACILVLYLFRKKKLPQMIAGYFAFLLFLGEISSLPAFLALAFYRGKKGISMKYFFYGFYPLHLLLLYLSCVLMGIAAYPVW